MSTKGDIISAITSISARFHRPIWWAPLAFLTMLALALIVPARTETQPAGIPFSDIGARATANYEGAALSIRATADGAALMRAGRMGSCGLALILAPSQMREHGLGPFGRADLHPRRNPLSALG